SRPKNAATSASTALCSSSCAPSRATRSTARDRSAPPANTSSISARSRSAGDTLFDTDVGSFLRLAGLRGNLRPTPFTPPRGRDPIEPTLAQACSTDRCELDVQLAEPPHDERRLVGVATGIGWTVVLLGDPDVGHPVEDPIQRDSALRTGERRTRARMDAADERDLFAHVMTIGTECVGIFELTLISVARSGKEHDRRAGGHFDISNGRRRARHSEVSLDRAFHP